MDERGSPHQDEDKGKELFGEKDEDLVVNV